MPQAPSNSTVIRGEATDQVCLDHASLMFLDTYHRDPSVLQSETKTELKKLDQYWDRVTTSNIGVVKPSGFYATLFTPKKGNDCPPTLAIRGTVFNDSRGIAFALRIKSYPSLAPNLAQEFSVGFAPGYEVEGKTLDETGLMDRIGWLDTFVRKGNWLNFTELAEVKPRVKAQIPLIPIGRVLGRNNYLVPNITIEAEFELWLNQDEGDWATNGLQGLGYKTKHYGENLMKAVDDAMDSARKFGNQLRITGHSLGGGLASAGAIYAKAQDPEMKIYGLTYDASGVHPNTAKDLFTSLDLASDAKIIARAVEDEVLTSLEKTSDFVPIISSLVRYTGNRLPPPIGTFHSAKGVSPGKMGGEEKGHEYARKWTEMPNLFPIEDQTLIPAQNGQDPLATWGNLAGLMANARNMEEMLEKFHDEISERVKAARADRDAQEAEEVRLERESEAADARREAAAERAEAAREAAAEQAEADAEKAAAAREKEDEANEPSGYWGIPWFFYNLYDEPRDFARGVGNVASEVGDEVRDVAVAAADEVGDIGREVWDEVGDGARNVEDAAGDLASFAYQHTVQYMHEFSKYVADIFSEAPDYGSIMLASVDYHNPELAVFTFALKKRG